jgi:hypothetical protein
MSEETNSEATVNVNVDESGIVASQNPRPSEWPKKLRTLTAAELDRLTIDSSGRFYWDGVMVNYDTGSKQIPGKTPDSLDRSMEILDRATVDLGSRKLPTTIEGQLAEPAGSSADPSAVELDVHHARTPSGATIVRGGEQTRLMLSSWQTLAAVIVALAIVVGAAGVATYGYVAAREWGCKTGAIHDGCPAREKAPARVDLPA